jgi:TolB protein
MQKAITQTGILAILLIIFSMIMGCTKQPTESRPGPDPEIKQIVFVSDSDGDEEIFVMNPDGTGVQQLTFNDIVDSTPAWSYDGQKIVFSSTRFGNESKIFKMNAEGSQVILLTSGKLDLFPDWSRHDKIVFQSLQSGNDEIFVMNADGSNAQNLTSSSADDSRPRWSPDGQRIVFYSNRDVDSDGESDNEIFVMNADGANLLQLTQNTYSDFDPSFSKDGSKIVFVSDRGNGPEIFVMDANGGNQQQLTNDGDENTLPIFASSFDKIAFVRRHPNTEIIVIDANGANTQKLTSNKSNDLFPDW